ncbi:MAG TPA: neutral zinc metallopeptidase [Pseudonocardia sp.]|nr:neutral zinc metallopeptidase [Pseudonocardia sp.]
MPSARTAARAGPALVLAAVLLLTGCTLTVPGAPSPIGTPGTSAPAAGPPQADPPLAAAVSAAAVVALEGFWAAEYPALGGEPWRPVSAYVPVEPDRAGEPAPPCVLRAELLTGQAFYCPSADAMVWDAGELMPQLAGEFGPAGVVVVLAHEVGHAVQARLGIGEAERRDRQRYPAVLLELMADCYAGAALRHFTDGGAPALPLTAGDRDAALRAITGFRDPLGIAASDPAAHGNAFDRVWAFQDGFADGAARCAAMSPENRLFTQRPFESEEDRRRGGDQPLDELLAVFEPEARAWFTGVATAAGSAWRAPPLVSDTSLVCDLAPLTAQGPAAFCPADGSVSVALDEMRALHEELGDYAGATLLATRYGLALVDALGGPTEGPGAGDAGVCLAGAFSGRLVDAEGPFRLSPGDLDEAVQVLLADDRAARDADGRARPGEDGFARVRLFTTGVSGGPQACSLPA